MDASSGVQSTDQIVCPACLVSLAADAEVCHECGTPTRDKPVGPACSLPDRVPAVPSHPGPGNPSSRTAAQPMGELPLGVRPQGGRPLLDRPLVILGLLFGVMAVLGLPLLWKSRAFGRPMKMVLSVVVTLYTAALIYGVGLICVWSYNNVVEALRH